MDEISSYIDGHYDPRRFTVRERFKFRSCIQHKIGETVTELPARIRHDAATSDFVSIKDPQDEAIRTHFICSVGNEAILKAVFKVKDDELSFTKAVEMATEIEDVAKVAKETVHGSKAAAATPVFKMRPKKETLEQKQPAFPEGIVTHKG